VRPWAAQLASCTAISRARLSILSSQCSQELLDDDLSWTLPLSGVSFAVVVVWCDGLLLRSIGSRPPLLAAGSEPVPDVADENVVEVDEADKDEKSGSC